MKYTFVATVLNEEDMIREFIDSILNQSQKPDEIIIVDGGSSDQTVNLIEKYKNIKLVSKPGNRSIGRNEGIRISKGDIILVSDGGCLLDKNWAKNITKPFTDKKVDVVSGYYQPVTNNNF